jgi:WD40 repeat protein
MLQGVRDINFSRDGRKFLSSSYDKSGIKLWDTETGQVCNQLGYDVVTALWQHWLHWTECGQPRP